MATEMSKTKFIGITVTYKKNVRSKTILEIDKIYGLNIRSNRFQCGAWCECVYTMARGCYIYTYDDDMNAFQRIENEIDKPPKLYKGIWVNCYKLDIHTCTCTHLDFAETFGAAYGDGDMRKI